MSAPALPQRGPGRMAANWREVGVWLILAALVATAAALAPGFLKPENLANIMRQSVALVFVALGQSLLLISGGMDISVGTVISTVVVFTNGYMNGEPDRLVPGILLALAIGMAVGLFNGLMVGRLSINPIVLTFAMMSILQGIIFVYTEKAVGRISPGLDWLTEGNFYFMPLAGLFVAGAAAVMYILHRHTVLGLRLQALGGHAENARRAGLNVLGLRLTAYMICSVMAASGGLFVASRIQVGSPFAGYGYELDSFAAAVLGGTSLAGGRGSMPGTVAGVLVLAVLDNSFNLFEVSPFMQQVVKGLIVIGSVFAYSRREGS